MCRKLFFAGAVILLLVGAAANPVSVQAEGDQTPTPEPVKPPWITGKNPDVSLSAGEEGELNPSGIIGYWEGVEVPLLAPPPSYVDLAPLHAAEAPPAVPALAIPQRYQDPRSVNCGAAALGMALEFLYLNGEGDPPSNKALVDGLKNADLLYENGTGVEELAYLARQHGYRGTTAFHNWTLEQIAEQLHLGNPVVVSLGANGAGKPGHFVTLSGVSADGQWVSYNDPILGAQTVPADEFLNQWNLQGNSGLVVQKQPLSMANDPMLPWMGLFGALSTLAVLVKSNPGRSDLKETLRAIRGVLTNPGRKGVGGSLSRGGGLRRKSRKLSSRSRKSKPKPKQRHKRRAKPKPRPTSRLESRRSVPSPVPRRSAQKMKTKPKPRLFGRIKKAASRVRSTVTKVVKSTVSTVRKAASRVVSNVGSTARRLVPSRSKSRTTRPRQSVLVATSGAGLRRAQVVAKSKPKRGGLFGRIGSAASNIASSVKKGVGILASSVAKTVNQRVSRIRTGASAVINRTRRPVGSKIKWNLEKKLTPTRTPTPYPSSTPSPFPNPTPATTPKPYLASKSGPNFWQELGIGLSGSMVKLANTINQKIKDPVQKTILNPSWWQDKVIQASKTSQSVLSLSASNEWDFNLFSQEGVIAQSYVPPNILRMLYVEQKFDIKPKVKITGNPGSLMDFDVTSGTWKVNLGEKLSIFSSIKGGGITLGVGIKKPGQGIEENYRLNKHSLSSTWRGLTHTYRQEGVKIAKQLSTEDLEIKTIKTLECRTQTIKTEGILITAGALLGISELLALAVPALEALPALPVIGTFLKEALSGVH